MKRKSTPCELRLMADLEETNVLHGIKITFPDENNIQHFIVRIKPESGLWETGVFDFEFVIPDDFPFQAPRVKCLTRIYHPNIDEEGAVCLNLLKLQYTPAISLPFIIAGLQYLFTEPNVEDPLNKEAARMMQENFNQFKVNVDTYICNYCPSNELE